MTPLTAEQFKAASARRRKIEDAEVPDFGVVRLRAMTAGDLVRFQHLVAKAKAAGEDPEELGFTALAWSWVNADGTLLFPEAEGIAEAKALDEPVYAALAKKVFALNGLTEDAGKN